MKKIMDPNLLVDETGLKNSREDYTCRACEKKVKSGHIQKKRWYYKIKVNETDLIHLEKNKIGYVSAEKVSYLCREDYSKLSKEEAIEFVEIGLPYFISLINQKGGIFSF